MRDKILIVIVIGGLLFGASIISNKVYALSDSPSSLPSSQITTQTTQPSQPTSTDTSTPDPTDTTNEPTTTDDNSAAPTTASCVLPSSSNDLPTGTSNQSSSGTDSNTSGVTTNTSECSQTGDATVTQNQVGGNTTSNPQSTTSCPTLSTTPSSDPTNTAGTTDSTDNTTTVSNNVNSCAQTGNATVTQNQVGGNATTGNSTSTGNYINSIESNSSLSNGDIQTFTDNINGDQNGNVVVNPNDIVTASTTSVIPTTLNSTTNTTINNDIDLAAITGNATVSDNQMGGNASSGNALTEANIVNLIDSSITASQTFVGVINIYGELNGDILIPSQFINTIMNAASSDSDNANINTDNNFAINNNINLAAITGNATVSDNQMGGNASSGNSTTSVEIYNLTGSQIIGGNVLLIFVDDLGNWIGLIMNAPSGTTSSAIGGQIQQDNSSSLPTSVTDINYEEINNTVNLTSVTGNATVSDNQMGGNASSGNATASVNIVNIVDSNLDLSGWLGILIINIFGTWLGSLGILTPNPVTPTTVISSPNVTSTVINTQLPINQPENTTAFVFSSQVNNPIVAASYTTYEPISNPKPNITSNKIDTRNGANSSAYLTEVILGVIVLLGIVSERLISHKQIKKA